MTTQDKHETHFRELRGLYEDLRLLLDEPDATPEICGYYGRACRRMLEHRPGTQLFLCNECPISKIYNLTANLPF